jgi:cytochrome c
MRVSLLVLAVAGALAGAATVQAQDALKGCVKCHDVDKKKVGPSLKDVAAKNKGKDQAALVAKLKEGKGHPKVAATDDELKAAVKAALETK